MAFDSTERRYKQQRYIQYNCFCKEICEKNKNIANHNVFRREELYQTSNSYENVSRNFDMDVLAT